MFFTGHEEIISRESAQGELIPIGLIPQKCFKVTTSDGPAHTHKNEYVREFRRHELHWGCMRVIGLQLTSSLGPQNVFEAEDNTYSWIYLFI